MGDADGRWKGAMPWMGHPFLIDENWGLRGSWCSGETSPSIGPKRWGVACQLYHLNDGVMMEITLFLAMI